MRYIPTLSILILLFALLSACGSQQAESLESKKAELKKLKGNLLALNQQIQQLESEIQALDPSAKQGTQLSIVSGSPLKKKTFAHFIEVQGKVEADKNAMISANTSGSVLGIFVKKGQYVKRGQVLAQLNDVMTQSTIQEVKTQLELANVLYEKQKKLWDQEIGTEVQYLTAKNQKASLESRLKTLEEQADLSKIKAPFSGYVDEIMPKIGEMVAAGYPAFRIVSAVDLSLKADISEAYSPYIRRGTLAKLKFPLLNKSFDAKVTAVGQAIDPNNRTFSIEIKLPNDKAFKANMFGEIAINDQNIKDAISIPLSVVQKSETGNFVYVAENQEGRSVAQQKEIELGLSYGGQVEIPSGLNEDDILIVSGYNGLSKGQEIQVEIEQ